MPTYVTRIRKPTGETEEQLLTVPQESQLDEYLSRLDGFVVDCRPCQSQSATAQTTRATRSVTGAVGRRRDASLRSRPAELVLFSRYLYTLVLARSKYVPHMVSSMISVGEETGNLSGMLQNVARFYDRDIQQTVRTLPKVLEPAVIVLMTVVVGVIAASVFLPLATMTKGIG